MSTKTMRLPPRRVLTPDKGKERDGTVPLAGKPPEAAMMKPPPIIPPVQSPRKLPATATAEPAGSNQLLAGYLAHEFLSKGTILGEQWNPIRSQTGDVPVQPGEPRKTKPSHNTEPVEPVERKRRRYVEVANLLRVDGTRLPGIVNPTQLARYLKL
ncbi:PREDICTED: uncharacterized protein LOC104801139 [Tarenaya hassleriana]|uniref:uncharacterized protein LOC104801139 n=1 Tax=Tarenaya hassleriana TaxID=28532 RepID=UPI00053C1585|nr:PREDICTED: uncharacterized protein LOC104801139 [Tarenaya hassleriana]XP_019056601.1 PREDICTED: uncharacterized protein LOC104801139 [Tarenaya hassleriana]XP_019056602.1 PREDICTED: uncharacterized protein LOC104801139 [Tarenaya hassleriana]XP_019056603.1 PREDICTED: uncharacterized protein LOC104801139 [Tarenaya hassleriana]